MLGTIAIKKVVEKLRFSMIFRLKIVLCTLVPIAMLETKATLKFGWPFSPIARAEAVHTCSIQYNLTSNVQLYHLQAWF